MMYSMKYPEVPEIILGDIPPADRMSPNEIPEVQVSYSRSGMPFLGHLHNADDIAKFLRTTFDKDTLELQEQVIVLYLNTTNKIICYYRHSKGGITSVVADIRIILAVALKVAAASLVLSHNHPSGSTTPSHADIVLTKKIKSAADLMSINVVDHFIITSNTYISFANKGILGLAGVKTLVNKKESFVAKVEEVLQSDTAQNKRSIEKLAATYGITDKTLVKELTELAIVKVARSYAHAAGSIRDRFTRIVELYYRQVNLSHRTSQSILLQQYSTPAPISYLAGIFCELDQLQSTGEFAFEPSAGNGLLTIAANPEHVCVNEIDSVRNDNLISQGYHEVMQADATKSFDRYPKKFKAVLTNPPFGTLDTPVSFEEYKITTLEQLMALRALETMMDDGKAAIIVGGHTRWDALGRVQAGRNRIFFNYLFSHYHVSDVINISGKKLYSRQGTSFDVRMILLDGRKAKPAGVAPLYNPEHDKIVQTFEELFERVMSLVEMPIKTYAHQPKKIDMRRIELEAKALTLKLQLSNLGALSGRNYIAKAGYVNDETMFREYQRLKKEHPNTVIFFETSTTFATFNDDAILLAQLQKRNVMRCYGLPYYAKGGILREDKYKKLKMFTKAGYDTLFIENDRANYVRNTRQGVIDYEIKYGKAHSAQDAINYQTYLEIKDRKTKNIVLFKQGWSYSAWGKDAKLVRPILSWREDLSLIDAKSKIIKGITFPSKQYKRVLNHFTREGYKVIIAEETLGAPYQPASNACNVLDTQVPDSMSFETQSAIDRIRQEVGGDMDNFVRHRLGYPTKAALCQALAAEQIDAVGVAIYNIEARNQGVIIGDQTGIGKGRVAASVIRYATQQGLKPVFLTEKANLFSDIYRDLLAIGSGHLQPFIVNGRESKTDIKDEDGNVIYQALPVTEQQEIFRSRTIPAGFDFVLATYSQFNSPEKKPEKPGFLMEIAQDNIFILDEAHNSSGSSNTGSFLQGVVAGTRGIVFLSATFAKRPDNMPIYAMKTAISDCTMSKDELVEAITRGGVALQEVLSAQLVAEGQMLRRERSFEGVEVNYISLDDKAEEHRAIADNITEVLRDIIAFQDMFVNKEVKELDKIAAAEGKETELRKGTSQAGVDNQPYFSKIFQVINQMLFSLKAASVAERAIMRLKEGKKPVIAFASTMGSFIETLENETGMPVGDGDTINADFSEVLLRGLEGVLRYTEKDVTGMPVYKMFVLSDLAPEAVSIYNDIAERIEQIATGITISPIDVIVKIIKEAGYTVAEVTGRKYELQLNLNTGMGLVLSRKKINTNDAFRKFNNNEVDVLLINQSGSTGASAHAIPTAKVTPQEVKQRVMIVLQAELDINTEVQKRGRINRTGQLLKPIYDYVTSAIPAEKRLMMMLQKKLKSLDANTTSNQKQSTKILDVPDFLNKYGDKLVKEYLIENPAINRLLDDPLKMESSSEDSSGGEVSATEDAAHRVSGRVAVLSTKMQQDFYNEISQRYSDYVEYLQQVGEYDLEVEAMNLQAETTHSRVVKMGNGSDSAFGDDSVLETVKANVLKKPFTAVELDNLLTEALQGKLPMDVTRELSAGFEQFSYQKLLAEQEEEAARYDRLIQEIPSEKIIRKLESNQQAWFAAIQERKKELLEAREKKLTLLQTKADNNKSYLAKLFHYFYPGRAVNYPVETFNGGSETVPAVFIGYLIDLKKKNPYVPSQVKLRFAIASSNKYLAIPASYSTDLMAVIGASADKDQPDKAVLLQEWETYIKQTSVDRKTRYIITGNLLQAFSDFKGKLVSYSTIDGQVKKGILLPEYWDPGEQVADNVTVPIIKALPLIRSLVQNSHITTNNGLSFFKHGQQFKIVVGGSRVKGGDIYLDKQLLALIEGGNFQKTSDKMVAQLDEKHINAFVQVLQNNHGLSMTVNSGQFRQIEKQTQASPSRKPIALPPPAPPEQEQTKVVKMEKRRRLELEAKAIKLKLQLLAAA